LAGVQSGRGLLLRDAGRLPEAKAALDQAVAIDPTASAAWFAPG
jgi:predicted RNA polymerase sigma factor